MRSSKSRSRNKQRNRPSGNIVNRVFDSSGPEGKVRGTPQQIIDKYNQLARDSQLSGDRVATENFQQHAEHYTRMLAEAQREQNERREQQEQQQRDRQQQRGDNQQHGNQDDGGQQGGDQGGNDGSDNRSQDDQQRRDDQPRRGGRQRGNPQRDQQTEQASADVIDFGGDGDSGLVETPEEKPKRKPRARKPKPKTEDGGDSDDSKDATAAE